MSVSLENRLPAEEWLESPYIGRIAGRMAYQYGLTPEDASDLLQEIHLALWKAGPATEVNATWIFQTARHKAIDIWRRRRIARIVVDRDREVPGRHAELLHLLHARVDRLPRRLRDLYSLRFEKGLSQRETARELGVLRCLVRSLERRCLRRIGARRPA